MWTSASFLAKPSLHSQKASLHGAQRRFSAIFIFYPQHLRHPRRIGREWQFQHQKHAIDQMHGWSILSARISNELRNIPLSVA